MRVQKVKIEKSEVKLSNFMSLGIILIAFLLTIYFMSSLYQIKLYIDGESLNNAENAIEQDTLTYDDTIDEALKTYSESLLQLNNFDPTKNYFSEELKEDNLVAIQLVKNSSYASYTYPAESKKIPDIYKQEVKDVIESGSENISKVYFDQQIGDNGRDAVAIYFPIDSNQEFSGAIFYCLKEKFIYDIKYENSYIPSFTAFCDTNGLILNNGKDEVFSDSELNNVLKLLYESSGKKMDYDTVRDELAQKQGSGCNLITLNSEKYIIAYNYISAWENKYYSINIYTQQEVLGNSYTLYKEIWITTIGLGMIIVILVIGFIYVILKHKKSIEVVSTKDAVLQCNTLAKFKTDTAQYMKINKFTRYSFLYVGISNFRYFRENFTPDQNNELLKFIAKVISKCLIQNETYGHIVDDNFLILLHYNNYQELVERIRVIDTLVNNFEQVRKSSVQLKLTIGIYCLEKGKNFSIQDMIDRAKIAQNESKKHADEQFVFYDDKIRLTFAKEAEIESKMELALKNKDFKLFFQPKYNIKKDRIDGAEALVRWYDSATKKYERPDEFIPLFEVNGFITKLDHYVFVEACKFMSESNVRGDHMVPISINASHVTASQSDFLDFYIKTKQRYNIPNKFLTIEFTESFAFNNYDVMKNSVTELRKNGFECSIDDFGSGFSSYNVLKELPMDEIKLDRFFLKKGFDSARDNTLLKSVIQLCRSLDMKVTQEGVETLDDMTMLKEFDCDVIQGYYYSKPIMVSDFIDFINKETSIKAVLLARML